MAERITVTRTKSMRPYVAGLMVDVLDSLADKQVPTLEENERIDIRYRDTSDLWRISIEYVGEVNE